MSRSQTVLIEFPIQDNAYSEARSAVDELIQHLSSAEYRVEHLVRVGNVLVDAWSPHLEQPLGYAYRIHLRGLNRSTWARLQNQVFQPLARQGLQVRAA